MPEWISVDERLPEMDERVLTLDRCGHIHDRRLHQFQCGVVVFSPDGLFQGKHITHWMPLPEPPKIMKE